MGSIDNDTYLLTRDTEETERLNEQHKVWTINNGYAIHPSIKGQLPQSGARIADVAAGSGAWTLDVAKQLSHSGGQVDGYDISSAQFPAEPPANTTFTVHNAKKAFPVELHGTYDVVHVRALVAAMDREDWELVVGNLMALLKPGGALQWTEADFSHMVCLRGTPTPSVSFQAVPHLLALFDEAARQRIGFGANDLAQVFRKSGLDVTETDIISSDRDSTTRTRLTSLYLTAMLGWANQSGTLTGEKLTQARLKIKDEVADGAYVRADVVTLVGIKAS